MTSLRLYKKEKLCSLKAIERLFSSRTASRSVMAYPWRAVWQFRAPDDPRPDSAQFVISVPKRRLRHAVDRVRMRRLMREAYRLNRHLLPMPEANKLDIAFIYVAPRLSDFRATTRSLEKIMARVSQSVHSEQQ